MKKIFTILMICAAALASCSKVEFGKDFNQTGVELTLKMAGVNTKAVTPMPGVDALNENMLNSINYYIFDGETLVTNGVVDPGKNVPAEGLKVNLGFSEEKFAEVFEAGKALDIYVIANAKAVLASKTIAKPADIDAVALTLAGTGKQDSFVMFGKAEIAEVASDTDVRVATSEVSLKRVVSKISLKLNLAENYQKAAGEPVWTPETAGIKVIFHNLEKNGVLSGVPVNSAELVDAPEAAFTAGALVDGYYPCTTVNPYYTYSRSWAFGDEDQPNFFISIPWSNGTETVVTYYKVILSNKSFESNNWYAVNVTLNGLGSLTPGVPVDVEECDVVIADWAVSYDGSFEYHTEADFVEARVLDIPQETVTLYNQNRASVAFYSTHPCTIVSVTQYVTDYKTAGAPVSTKTVSADGLFTISGNEIVFTHTLDNDIASSSFDYKDYVYKVRIAHSDNSSYYDEFTVIQKPAMSIAISVNQAGDSGRTTFVNGNYGGQTVDYGTLPATVSGSGSSNKNPDMYVISVASLGGFTLSDGTAVMVGDPRTKEITLNGFSSTTATSIQGSQRKLTYYYPVSTDSGNVIAPKLRIASSHGVTNALTSTNAFNRCASYQEDGYPAGRWRMPTRAEIEFITTLSSRGYIMTLFTSNYEYWCSGGYMKVGDKYYPGGSGSKYVRCVYDEWYWENTDTPRVSDRNTFTWGDMER